MFTMQISDSPVQFVDVEPGQSIRLYGAMEKWNRERMVCEPVAYDRTFRLNDVAVTSSYNLTYTGRILSIGKKTIIISETYKTKSKRFSFRDFSFWNHDYDADRVARDNVDALQRI